MGFYEDELSNFMSIPRGDWLITSSDLMLKWKDNSDWNEIFDELMTQEDYDRCIVRAIQRFNGKHPYDFRNPKDFPYVHRYLLLDMSMYEVLNEICLYKMKNFISGSNAGIEMTIHNNVQLLIAERDRINASVTQDLTDIKGRKNQSALYTAIYSYPPYQQGI